MHLLLKYNSVIAHMPTCKLTIPLQIATNLHPGRAEMSVACYAAKPRADTRLCPDGSRCVDAATLRYFS